jgi:hypothetical protein
MTESINVLQEAIELQKRKALDYNNPNSRIKRAMYYPRGIASIADIINGKLLRIYSVLEAMENDKNYAPNFESVEDSLIDMINYASFAVEYARGKMEGQNANN